MHSIARAFAVAVVFVGACVAWITLGAIMSHRSTDQKNTLESRVNDLWGRPHVQRAPVFTFRADADDLPAPNALGSVPAPAAWASSPQVASPHGVGADGSRQDLPGPAAPVPSLRPASSRIGVDLDLDARQKGLTWYALYDVGFDGAWVYRHESDASGTLTVGFAFPDPNGVYDGFRFEVNGEAVDAQPSGGGVATEIPVAPGDEITVHAAYQSRGLDEWRYAPSDGAGSLRDFELVMRTDFDAVDFPSQTLSPSERRGADGGGEELVWRFEQVVSGYGIGMVMPQRLQPGELASELAFSAPISLLFFFLIIGVLARLRALDVHPINYFFLAAAFFSFHLLFAYTADHLPVWAAFGLASAVSVTMVVTYLRLVVSRRFAFFEAGIAQLVYLVGFSLAHFAQGFTGVTVTVLSIATLFVLMLLTGRIRWSTVLDAKLASPPAPAGVANGPMGAPGAHAYAEVPRPV